jgi:DNA-directed RNA polymerase
MVGHKIYFPTFLDFRGRIYPTPNYLSYQGNDLARSLLLFDNVENNLNFDNNILNNIFIKDSSSDKLKIKKLLSTKMEDINYFKLYLANVFGKGKLNRNNRLK